MAIAFVLLTLLLTAAAAGPPGLQERGASPLLERVTTVEREVPGGYGGGLRVESGPVGSVQISAWRERKVRIEARIELHAPSESDLDELARVVGTAILPDMTGVTVSTTGPHDKEFMKSIKRFPKSLSKMPWRVDYVIWVPEYTSLDVRVNSGETLVEGVTGVSSIRGLQGPIRLVNVSGSVATIAGVGNVEVKMLHRTWTGGSLLVNVAKGDVTLRGPSGFSATIDATASKGVTLVEGEPKQLGPHHRGPLGTGGAEIKLTATDGSVTIVRGEDR